MFTVPSLLPRKWYPMMPLFYQANSTLLAQTLSAPPIHPSSKPSTPILASAMSQLRLTPVSFSLTTFLFLHYFSSLSVTQSHFDFKPNIFQRVNLHYQWTLQSKDGGWPRLFQWLHTTSPAPATIGISLLLLEVKLPAKQRGIFPALTLWLVWTLL